jgi:hypothetical protein
MAISAVTPVYFGQAAASFQNGQIPSQGGISGTQSKVLYGIATFTLDGATTTGLTVNWIDGTQIPFVNNVVLPVSSVTAPATIGGVANQAVYSGVGAYGQLRVGQSVTFAGFTNAGNNGTFTINALTTNSIQVTNSSSVLEGPNPSGTVKFNQGTIPAVCRITRAMANAAGVLDTAALTTTISAVTQAQATGTFTISAAGSNGQLLSVLVEIIPAV